MNKKYNTSDDRYISLSDYYDRVKWASEHKGSPQKDHIKKMAYQKRKKKRRKRKK